MRIDDLLATLSLAARGEGGYAATSVDLGGPVVGGGQLLAQSIIAGNAGHEGKRVQTIQTVFTRGARTDSGLRIDVERVGTGRNLSSTTVTFVQDDRVCARSTLLLSTDEPDVIRHADLPPRPGLVPPADPGPQADRTDWHVCVVDGVDVRDPESVGPPDLEVWTRLAGAPDDPLVDQALLAFATDVFLIGTAMRPHPGIGTSQSHRTLSTAVLTHTMTFHEPCAAADWFLITNHSSYAGRGRCHGRGDVFAPDGTLAASFAQDGMIRRMPEARGAL